MISAVLSWQMDRSRLNHNWLQNSVLVALHHAVNVTAGRVLLGNPKRVLVEDVARWKERRQDVLELLGRFESEMSPSVLFGQIPLIRCSNETKDWLVPLTHELWLRREKVQEKMDAASDAYKSAESAYKTVKEALDALPESPTVDDLGPIELLLRAFTASCEALSRVVSTLPNEIRCV
jgi:hypothetical protein